MLARAKRNQKEALDSNGVCDQHKAENTPPLLLF